MSLEIRKDVALGNYTTLGVGGSAQFFAEVTAVDELREAVSWAQENRQQLTVLGGGSNVLIDDSGVQGLVLHLNLKGSLFASASEETVLVTAQAGELLDSIVAECVSRGLWGMENLSYIPGTVGATPVQNVGAYGVEIKDVVEQVTVFNIETKAIEVLQNSACAFGYRDSLFKSPQGKKYIVTEVTFRLSTHANPKMAYTDLKNYFKSELPSLAEIRNAVIEIRSKKFPDWNHTGTAGSFFKNPTISTADYIELLKKYPELPGFASGESKTKISLGWILDKVLHLKGYSDGPIATYANQALVLIVEKNAVAKQVENFANSIVQKVKNETGIAIEWEVTKLS